MIEQIQKVDVFKYCKKELINLVSEHLTIKEDGPGTTILSHGEDSKHVYIILEGSLMIVQLAEDGKVVGFELVKKGGCFGEMSAVDGSSRSASVLSLGHVKLGIINYTFFRNYLLRDYDFCRGLLVKFTRVVRSANQQIFSLATANARKRLLLQIVRLSTINKNDPSIIALEQGLSHTAIGSFAGISRETVSRLIGDLKNDGVIWINESGQLEMNIEKTYKELSSLLSA
jgi:CRP-like cAMP-binding protein